MPNYSTGEKHDLLLKQKNEVFESIRSTALNIEDFKWDFVSSERTAYLVVPRLRHKSSGYYYIFDSSQGKHYSISSPGKDMLREEDYPGSWGFQLQNVRSWLERLYDEVKQPDFWGQIEGGFQQIPEQNTRFTSDEQELIVSKLKELYGFMLPLLVDTESQAEVKHKLDYLLEQSSHQGRRDWMFLFLGVIFNIATTWMTPDNTAKLYGYLRGVKFLLGS